MSSTPEGKSKDKIKAYLKTLPNCWFFMPMGGPYTTHGIPDIVGCIAGKFFAIEVKAVGKEGNTTCNQDMQIAAITGALGLAFVASDVQHVKDIFRRWNFIP